MKSKLEINYFENVWKWSIQEEVVKIELWRFHPKGCLSSANGGLLGLKFLNLPTVFQKITIFLSSFFYGKWHTNFFKHKWFLILNTRISAKSFLTFIITDIVVFTLFNHLFRFPRPPPTKKTH